MILPEDDVPRLWKTGITAVSHYSMNASGPFMWVEFAFQYQKMLSVWKTNRSNEWLATAEQQVDGAVALSSC